MTARANTELRTTGNDILAYKASHPDMKVSLIFGVEVCEVNHDGYVLLDKSMIGDIGLHLVIGGVHETHCQPGASLAEVARVQHQHHMLFMENPLIHILVHPWWFDKAEFERLSIPWPEDMSFIPREYTVELAHASARTKTYIEISTMSGLLNKDTSRQFKEDLKEYYRLLAQEGAYFAIGTDAHELSEMDTVSAALDLVKELQIPEERLWRPELLHIEESIFKDRL